VKLLKDLLYGGRNEYLDIVRLLGLVGGLTFIGLEIAKFVRTGVFDEVQFGLGWASVFGATVAGIYARNHSDQRERGTDAAGAVA
jgi:hypothetical protein